MKMEMHENSSRKGSVVLFVPAPEFIHEDQCSKQFGEQEAASRRLEDVRHRFQQEPLPIPFPRTAYCGIDFTEPYAHQAGGTRHLRQLPGKFMVAKPCTERELWFYSCEAASLGRLAPLYHGPKRLPDGKPAVLLQDLTSGMKCPCVLDIKMGVCTAAPDRSEKKRVSCAAKDKITTTGSIGARLCGLRVYQVKTGQFKMKNKHWGKAVQFGEFAPALERFFNNGERIRRGLAKRFLEKLQPILEMMQQRGKYRYYASSILFIYEGWEGHPGQKDGAEGDEGLTAEEAALQENDSDCRTEIDVRMIDFAHVFPLGLGERDESYLSGLRNLIAVFQGIADGEDASGIKIQNHIHDHSLHVHELGEAEMQLPEPFRSQPPGPVSVDVTS